MNPLVAILDEELHGFPQLLDRSPLLLSVILAVAARVHRQELYTRTQQAASNFLALAAEKDHCSIEYIQALSIVVFWRRADDETGWRKTGLAIRMAYELGLHRRRATRLPGPPIGEEYREILVSP